MGKCVKNLNRLTTTTKNQELRGLYKLGKTIVMTTITEQQRNNIAAIPKNTLGCQGFKCVLDLNNPESADRLLYLKRGMKGINLQMFY